jgi:hypothetical protein
LGLWIKIPLSLCVTQHISFTHHTASNILITKTLLGHPVTFLVLVYAQIYMVAAVPVFRALLPALSRNSGIWVHLQIWKVVSVGRTSGCCNQAAGHVSPGKGQGLPGIEDPLKNPDKWISFDEKGASTYSLQLSRHVSTKWLTVASTYIPDTAVPAPHLGFVQSKLHNLSQLTKRLVGWAKSNSLAGNFHRQWSCTRIWKKKQEPFKQCKPPKMATWGIFSNLRGWYYFDEKDHQSWGAHNFPVFLQNHRSLRSTDVKSISRCLTTRWKF